MAYVKITSFTLGSATRDSFKVNWATDRNVNRVEYKIGSGHWAARSDSTAKSGSFTVGGRSAGTTYSVTIRVRAADSGLWTESSAKSISTVAAAKGNTPTLSSRTCIQAVMNWTSTQTCINVQYRIGSGSWQSTGSNFSARSSGSFTITGLSPNTSYSISIRVLDAVHRSWSGASGGVSITTYRLTTAGAPTFNTGSSFTVSLSRAHSSITHDVTLQFWHDNQSWADVATVTGAGANVTFSLNATQLNKIYNGRVWSKTSSTRLKIVNKWGGVTQGTSYSSNGTVTIVNAAPTIDGVSYLDTNSAVQALLGNDQKILRNKSTLRVVAGKATSQKGAYLSSYRVTIGGNEYSVSANGGTSESGKIINVGTVNQSANQTAVLTVVDSRGYTASKNFTVQMLDYAAPQFIRASADRLNSYEEPTTMNINARRAIVKPASTDVNVVEMRYRIKQNPSGSYGSYINLVAENGSVSGVYQNVNVSQYMGDYPNDQSYTVEIGIRDKFTDWSSILVTLPEGIPLLRFTKDKIITGVQLEAEKGLSIDGYTQQRRVYSYGKASGAGVWYRAFVVEGRYFLARVSIIRAYSSPAPETYDLSVAVSYNKANIVIVNKCVNSGIIKKVRLVRTAEDYMAFDYYYNYGSYDNNVRTYAYVDGLSLDYVVRAEFTTVAANDGTVLHEIALN